MSEVVKFLLELVRLGVSGISTGSGTGGIDMRELYRLACEQGVQALVWDGMKVLESRGEFSLKNDIPRALRLEWALAVEKIERTYKTQYLISENLAEIYAEKGIQTVVLKGIAASLWYPQPNHRPCGDLDCFLMGQFERGNNVAVDAGAKLEGRDYKHSHINYKGLMIENHCFCLPIRGKRRLKKLEYFLETLLCEELEKIGETQLQTPPALFNAIFLTSHAQRHLLSEGITLRHLTDWALLLRHYSDTLDWQEFRSICQKNGMLHFADTMTRLSIKYLGISRPKNYDFDCDEHRDETLLLQFFYGLNQVYNKKVSNLRRRLLIIKNIKTNKEIYNLFSDRSYFCDLFLLATGFIFDRNPKLIKQSK